MDLRDAIQRIALEWPSYGRPRITARTAPAGWTVNPKRVYRLHARGQPAVRAEAEVRGDHRFQPRRARSTRTWRGEMALTGDQSALGGRHHLHPAAGRVRVSGGGSGRLLAPRDRLGAGPDAGRRSDAGGAAHGAWLRRAAGPGLVHHSDRGTQYASDDYTDLLKAHGIDISMSRERQSLGQCGLRIVHENAEI